MNERAAAKFTSHLGGLEPAGSSRAQQRGQSPHTAVMWHPDGTRETPGCVSHILQKGNVEFL